MVNKAALAVLGVIVLVSMGVGVLIGMQLGASGGIADDGGDDDGASDGPTPIPTDTATGTPIPTATPTATAIPPTEQATTTTENLAARTTVPSRRFDRRDVEAEVRALINERRRSNGLEELTISGNTVDRLTTMARRHSDEMADAGRLAHTVDGNTSESRYQDAGLYDTCRFTDADGGYVISADDNSLESLGQTVAGRPYQDEGETWFNENETEVARALVDNWFDNPVYRDRLDYENARYVGVGVEITQDGTVYATANVC
jgi:hypothetical protein